MKGCMAKGIDARQREECTAKTLPCSFGEAHGNDGVADADIAVQSLLCGTARQWLCRANNTLCRPICLHGNDKLSHSATVDSCTNAAIHRHQSCSSLKP
jgi:hypothetical protein